MDVALPQAARLIAGGEPDREARQEGRPGRRLVEESMRDAGRRRPPDSGAAASWPTARPPARYSEAVRWLQEAAAPDPPASAAGVNPSWLGAGAHAHLESGRAEDALREAGRALDIARSRGEHGHEGWILHLLGDIATRQDPPDSAAGHARYRAALALAEARGMRPLVARCHLSLATLHRRTGDPARAEEHRPTAAAMLREMDMRFWLEAIERGD